MILLCVATPLIVEPVQAQDRVVNDGTLDLAPAACTTAPDDPAIQDAIDNAASGDVILVCPGTYAENVTVDKAVTLNGANDGTVGNGSRSSESLVDAGNGIGLEVTTTASVEIDGIEFVGDEGIVLTSDGSVQGQVTVQNNRFLTDERGVVLKNFTADNGVTVAGNFLDLTQGTYTVSPSRDQGSEVGTVGIELRTIDGTGSVSVSDNDFSDGGDAGSESAFYGILFDGVTPTSRASISGGSIQGTAQAIAVLDGQEGRQLDTSDQDNSDATGTQSPDASFFDISGVSASSFTGSSSNGAISLHAGIFVYTGGNPSATVTSDGQISNVTITGTGTANETGNSSAGLYFGGFSTQYGNGNFDQSVTATNVTVQDNENRGVYARGADVTATVQQSTITGNGDNAVGGDNPGFGVIAREGASLTVEQSVITNPSSASDFGSTLQSQQTFTVENTTYRPTLTVTNCKIDRNGLGDFFSGSEEVRAAGNAWLDGTLLTSGSAIAGSSSGLLNDFNPFLNSATDTQGGTAGFQGDLSSLTVTTAGDQLGTFGDDQRIEDGINEVTAGGTVTVEAGTFSETVVVEKSVTLAGNNAGTAGSDTRNPETIVEAGTPSPVDRTANIGFTVREDDVTIDGFKLAGNHGVVLDPSRFTATNDGVGLTVKNNLIATDIVGVDVRNVTTTGSRSFTLTGNRFEIQRQIFDLVDAQEPSLGGDSDGTDGDEVFEYTASVSLRTIDGEQAPTIQNNVVATDGEDDSGGGSDDGSFYGYAIDGLKVTSGPITIAGDPGGTGTTGTISGTAQGIAVLDGQSTGQSDLIIEDFSISAMSGSGPNDAVNFHAGIFTYNASSRNSATTDVVIKNTTVEGLDYSDPFGKGGATSSANIYLSNFDYDPSGVVTQNVTLNGVTIQNTEHRGLSLAGNAAEGINATITDDAGGTNTVIQGVAPGADGTGGTGDGHAVHAEGSGSPTINNTTITNAATSGTQAIHVRPASPAGEVTIGTDVAINSAGQDTFGDLGGSGSASQITVTDAVDDLSIDGFQQDLSSGNGTLVVKSGTDLELTGTGADTHLSQLAHSQVTLESNTTISLGSGTHEATSDVSLADVETQDTGSGGPTLMGSGVLNVTNLLTLSSGTFDVSNGTLTLPSTSESDVGSIAGSGSGTVTGDVTMERYIDKGDDAAHFRFLSSPFPVYLDDAGTTGNSANLLSNVNTQATGSGANFSVAESDASVFTFDESVEVSDDQFSSLSEGWNDVQNVNDAPITPGNGYLVYLFQDNGGIGPNGFPVTLSVSGSVPAAENDGTDQAPALSFTDNDPDSGGDASPDDLDGWNLIANPFAAPIDWESIENDGTGFTNVDATVYVLQADGTYAEYTADPSGTSGTGTGRYIAPFQAFFVKVNGSSPDFSITSDDKAVGQAPSFKEVTAAAKEDGTDSPRVVLELHTEDGSRSETTAVTFMEEAKTGKDAYDAYQLSPFASTYAQLATTMEGTDVLFAHQTRPVPSSKTTVGIAQDITAKGSYVLSAKTLEGLPDGWNVILEDVSTGERYDLRAGEQVRFEHSRTSSSTRSEKPSAQGAAALGDMAPAVDVKAADVPAYRLHVGTGAALPVELAGFRGQTEGRRAILTWKTLSETGNAGFEVQRRVSDASASGGEASRFRQVGFVEGHGTTTETHRYRFEAEDLPVGEHTFRLRQVDTDGRATVSEPTTLKVGLQAHHVVKPVAPNPVRHRGTLEFAVQDATPVTATLYNTLGQRVQVLYQGTPDPDTFTSVPVRAGDLASGVYFLRVQGEDFVETRRLSVVR